jgi:peptidoglycan/LPS O-acetylase OafA/YrhL
VAAGGAKAHFPGLNCLRFLAAFFVILDHVPLNQAARGLPHPSNAVWFFRGSFAVSFFFTLSGFLITYLLLDERQRQGEIRVRSFYLRRICRIWPLYFAVILLGLLFYNLLLPRLGIPHQSGYSLSTALLLYTLLLPNLINNLHAMGGLLNPTWSIGVEEQFYLLWAPALKRWRDRLPVLCLAVLAAFLLLFCLARWNVFGPHEWKRFVQQLKFHYLAAGGLCAWWLHARRRDLLALPVFSSRLVQLVLLALLLDLYLTNWLRWGWFGDEAAQLVLYCWLIVNVAANPVSIVPAGNRAMNYLGTISYGIYMLHMFAVYATTELFTLTSWWHGHLALYSLAYYGLTLGLTLIAAHLSYRWFELPFLRLKDRRFAPLPPALRQEVAAAAPGSAAAPSSAAAPPAPAEPLAAAGGVLPAEAAPG